MNIPEELQGFTSNIEERIPEEPAPKEMVPKLEPAQKQEMVPEPAEQIPEEPTGPESETIPEVKESEMIPEPDDSAKTVEPTMPADEGNIFDRIAGWFASLFG